MGNWSRESFVLWSVLFLILVSRTSVASCNRQISQVVLWNAWRKDQADGIQPAIISDALQFDQKEIESNWLVMSFIYVVLGECQCHTTAWEGDSDSQCSKGSVFVLS